MKYLIFFLTVLTIASCSKDEKTITGSEHHASGGSIWLYVENEAGEDLLNPKTADGFKEEEIIVYYKIDNKVVEMYDPMMDAPRKFDIMKFEKTGRYGMMIYLNDKHEKSITYLQWNESDTDTLKAEYRFKEGDAIECNKIWYNDKLVFEWQKGYDHDVLIIK